MGKEEALDEDSREKWFSIVLLQLGNVSSPISRCSSVT
jgi:hypothetical protein